MQHSSTLIMLRGNSGSGKTTLAHRLQRQLGRGTLVISQDVVRRDMLYATDGPGTLALPLLIELARYGRAHCDFVILEGILDAQVYDELFRAVVQTFDRIFAYYYDLPFEETLLRHATKACCNEFGEAEMRRWWKSQDYIGWIPETPFTQDVSQEDALSRIIEDVRG